MTPFANSRTKRRITSVMLVFWLFAWGAGWANACVLQERATPVHPDASAHAGAPTVPAGAVGVPDDHGAGDSNCLEVCDGSAQSLVKWPSGIDLLEFAAAPPTTVAWPAFDAALDAPRAAHAAPPVRAGPPLRTRYSRLAL